MRIFNRQAKAKELELFPIRRKKKNSDMRISELNRVDKKELSLLSPSIISQIKGE